MTYCSVLSVNASSQMVGFDCQQINERLNILKYLSVSSTFVPTLINIQYILFSGVFPISTSCFETVLCLLNV